MRQYTFFSPAKINLTLQVMSKRSDGYHLLLSDMVGVDLWDKITIFSQAEKKTILEKNYQLPDQQDLIWQAIQLLEQETKKKAFPSPQSAKKIPLGAGLGGGSSNAAAVLLAYNKIFSLGVSAEKLVQLAQKLGADVPFFLYQKQLRMGGIGELPIADLQVPTMPILLLKPSFSLATPKVFRLCKPSAATPLPTDYNLTAIQNLPQNVLFDAACQLQPKLQNYYQKLLKTKPLKVQMSGSGSSLFAIYKNNEQREQAKQKISTRDCQVYALKILNTWKIFKEEF